MSFPIRSISLAFSFMMLILLCSCGRTPAQQSPSIVHLTGKNEPGKSFTLDIQVLDVTNNQPVADVEVFAYHTNNKGDYEEDASGIARIHGMALSDNKGNVEFITIYPRGYNDSPTGEHIHFRIKGSRVVSQDAGLMFSDYYNKRYDYDHPTINKCYLKSLEEKDGALHGKAIIYVKRK